MSFFRRRAEPERTAAKASVRTETNAEGETRLARGIRIEGEVEGSAPVVVEGVILGQIRLGSRLTVAPGGRVAGAVEADVVRVEGVLEGDVRARERFELLAGGSMSGEVSAPRIVIAEGAHLEGQIQMESGAAEALGAAAARQRDAG